MTSAFILSVPPKVAWQLVFVGGRYIRMDFELEQDYLLHTTLNSINGNSDVLFAKMII